MKRTLSGRCRIAVFASVATGLFGCGHPSPAPSSPTPSADTTEVRAADTSGRATTDAVSSVDGDELHGTPAVQVEELLEGRVAGVQVLRAPGGGISIRIRGQSSINGDNEPLYVVDGMPVFVAEGRGLNWLNPGDIKRIEILKDASATSLYGMRGANGVVLITTRRGSRR